MTPILPFPSKMLYLRFSFSLERKGASKAYGSYLTRINERAPTPHLRLALLMILSTNILRENFSMVQKPVSGKLGQR